MKFTWSYAYQPNDRPGGLRAVNESVCSRLLDNMESYADDAAINTVWSTTAGTITLEETVEMRGSKSLKLVTGAANDDVYRAIDNAIFGYPFPGNTGLLPFRYISFKMKHGGASGVETVRVKLYDASDSTLNSAYLDIEVGTSKYREIALDLDPDNTESMPDFTFGANWDPALIDRIGFTALSDATTFYIDDIELFYEHSILDMLGFGSEAPVAPGDIGTVQGKLNYAIAAIKGLEGRTYQYIKNGPNEVEVGQSVTWSLGLLSDFAPPGTTEIVPGNYTIDRVRHGTQTEIVSSVTASESAGRIYATYQPEEDNWTEGDLVVVEFSGGYIRSDEDPVEVLTGDSGVSESDDTLVTVDNAYQWQVGWLVRIYDATAPIGEWHTIASIESPTTFKLSASMTGDYETSDAAYVTRAIRTDLDTTDFYTRVTREPTQEFRSKSWTESDHEEGDWASAVDTEHWDFNDYKAGGGTQEGDINTTTAGKIYLKETNAGDYAAINLYEMYSKYFRAVVDLTATYASTGATGSLAGLAIFKGTAYDANNHVEIGLFEDSGATDRVQANADFGGASETQYTFSTADDAVALMIERMDRTWRLYYSLTMCPDYEWTLLAQYDDDGDDMGEQTTAVLFVDCEDAGASVQGDFDNFKYFINSRFLEQIYNQPAIIPIVSKQEDPRVDQNTTTGIETFRIGLMDIKNGLPTTAEITPGTTLVDSFREGTDSDWTNEAGETITNSEALGYIAAAYDYPNAIWQPGDLVRFRVQGVLVTDAATSRVYTLPELTIYNIVGGPPNADYTGNLWLGDVIGNKSDAPDYTFDATTSSIVAYVKGILGSRVIEEGTLTTDSQTVPADNGAIAAYVNDYFNGCFLMPVAGACAFQPRLIVDFTNTTGVFKLDPEHAFTTLPGTSAYVIIAAQGALIPGVDGTNNDTPAHVIGGKADTADYTYDVTTSSLMRLIKGILGSRVIAEGSFTTGSATEPIDTSRTEANDWFNGGLLMPVAGDRAFQPRLIVDWDLATTKFYVDPQHPFTATTGTVAYVVISDGEALVPGVDQADNYTPGDVVGNKSDTAGIGATATIINMLRGIIAALGIVAATGAQFEVDGVSDLWDALVYDSSGLAAITDLTGNRDGAVIERLAAISNALGIIDAGAATGFEEDATGTSAFDAIVGVNHEDAAGGWMSGAAQRALADMPYVMAMPTCNESPLVDQDSQDVITLSLHNLRPDSDAILTAEITDADYRILRYRKGLDTDWTEIVADAAMTNHATAGFAYAKYTFPAASWQEGDRIQYEINNVEVTIAGQTFTLPTMYRYGEIGSTISLTDIYNEVVSLMSTSAVEGTATVADIIGTEVEVFSLVPVGVAKPIVVKVNMDNMLAADDTEVRVYYQATAGGGWVLDDYELYEDADGGLLNSTKWARIYLEANPHGVKVTICQTAGVARTYAWTAVMES